MNSDDKSGIEDLKKSLYSPNTPDIRTKRRLRFTTQEVDVKTDWEHPKEVDESLELNKKYKDNSMSFFTKILIASIIIFIIAISAGAYLLLNGSNIVSANNIDITINGPVSVAGGEPVSFDIQVLNKNNIKLEIVDLSVDFPAGTVEARNTSQELKNFRELMPDIEIGGVGQKTIQAVVYGEENSKKEIKVTVEYRVKGSNAIFQKEKIFDLLISSSPLTLSVSSFKEVNSGQEFEMALTMTSNSKEVIKNLLIKAIYPFGYRFISSDIKTFGDTSTWNIGDIPSGGKKILKIRGKLEGQDDETRVFRFSTGAQSIRNNKIIGTEYVSSTQEIGIKKPFISIGVSLSGDDESLEYVASFNNPVRVEVSYFNNLPTQIIDGEIHVKISGSAFDKFSISPEQGIFRASTNEIVWNSITSPALKSIEAGGNGRVGFSITPKNLSSYQKPIINPDITMVVNVNGNRSSENNVPESIVSSAQRRVKVSSDINLDGQIVRSIGPFENIGPIPPKADIQTTYTVIWSVDNTSNSITNAQVKSSLPPYVKWIGKIDPSSEDIKYNSVDGQIVWNIGSLGTYTLNNANRRQVSFQVGLNPSVTQINKIPTLVNQAILTAQDNFTNQALDSNLSLLNTRFSTDPIFKDGDEKISE